MRLHMLSGLFNLSPEQCCFGGVLRVEPLKPAGERRHSVCADDGQTDRPEC